MMNGTQTNTVIDSVYLLYSLSLHVRHAASARQSAHDKIIKKT